MLHIGRTDTSLNNCQQIISGKIKSTPTEYYIMPPEIKRNMAVLTEAQTIYSRPELPITGIAKTILDEGGRHWLYKLHGDR